MSRGQVDGLMDALALQAAMEVFDIHLLPYVAEEVMMEISQASYSYLLKIMTSKGGSR